MFWSGHRRRQRLAGIESEADRLVVLMGVDAYAAARRLEREANDFSTMRYWASVQTIIARKTGNAAAFDPARQLMIFDRPKDDGFDLDSDGPAALAPPIRTLGAPINREGVASTPTKRWAERDPDESGAAGGARAI